jgi:hypothetical protein
VIIVADDARLDWTAHLRAGATNRITVELNSA